METVLSRTRLWLVAIGYAAVVAVAAVLIVARYVQYVTHPADVAAYGGMYAGGDLMLEVFIGGMLLVVTFFSGAGDLQVGAGLHDLLQSCAWAEPDRSAVGWADCHSRGEPGHECAGGSVHVSAVCVSAGHRGAGDEPSVCALSAIQAADGVQFARRGADAGRCAGAPHSAHVFPSRLTV